MITIYKDKGLVEGKLEELNDRFFNRETSQLLDERAEEVIALIDNTELVEKYKIRSRFSSAELSTDKLSTSCKTILNILYFPDKVFSIKECGDRALDYIYTMESGAIWCDYPIISFEFEKVLVVDASGEHEIHDYVELMEWWENKK